MGLLDNIFDDNKKKDEKKTGSAGPNFDDVRSGSSSAPAPSSTARTYTVVAGDSLSRIAKRELGDANKWNAIYEANRDSIKNPDLIHPGQVLNLPANS